MQDDFNNEFSHEESIDNSVENNEFQLENFEAEKINILKSVKKTNSSKGIKSFCIVIAVTILLSCFSFGGYYVGKNISFKPITNNSINVNLENKPSSENAISTAEIYSRISPSVVGIFVYNGIDRSSEASGVVYSADGYIITNDHIYSEIPSAKFKILTSDNKVYDAHYVAGDTRSDLAVLKISENVNLTAATFGDSDEVVSGEIVCAIGYPNGYNSKATITTGIVSTPSIRASISSSYSSNFIQTDTAINPGNSGGALINEFGQIIGITSSKISGTSYEGVGFAIPSKTVKKITESLIKNGNVKDRAKLGISYNFYDTVMAELSNLASPGLLVREVSTDSDLYGKLVDGDVITRVNDIAITDDDIVLDLLEQCKPGDRLLLTVNTATGETVTVSAKLLSDEGSSSYVEDTTKGF